MSCLFAINMKFLLYSFVLLKFCEGSIFVNEDCIDIKTRNYGNDESIKLYLMPHTDSNHKRRNDLFIEWTSRLGFKVGTISVHPDCSLGHFTALEITDKLIKKYANSNIINLKVKAFFNYMSDYYEGKNADVVIYTDVEYIETEMEVFKCYDKGYEFFNCSIAKEHIHELHLKLTSPLKYKTLYEIIEHIDDNHYVNNYISELKNKQMGMPIQKHSIIICAEKFDSTQETEHMKFYVIKDCKTVNNFKVHDVLAVIAPKPLESEALTYLPVIFYDTPYLLPKHEAIYRNSITMYNYNFDEITKRIVNILQDNKWSRVAMVSDDSPNSGRFEEKMIEHFTKHSMVYSVQQCSGLKCNFTKALKWLKQVDARIIVANTDEKYVLQLARNAADAGFRANDKVLWILRHCPLSVKSECLKQSDSRAKRNVLKKYTTLQTLGDMLCFSTSSDDNEFSNGKHLQISEALNYIYRTFYKKTPKIQKKILEYSLPKRSRIIINGIKNTKKYSKMYDRHLLINDTDCEFFQLHSVGSLADYSDVIPKCTLRNYNFESPCDDTCLLTFLLVILAVLVLVLLFVIFLKKCHPRLRKYSTFH